jgi:hypothetical protein
MEEETGGMVEETGGMEEEIGGMEEEIGGMEEETGGMEEETNEDTSRGKRRVIGRSVSLPLILIVTALIPTFSTFASGQLPRGIRSAGCTKTRSPT